MGKTFFSSLPVQVLIKKLQISTCYQHIKCLVYATEGAIFKSWLELKHEWSQIQSRYHVIEAAPSTHVDFEKQEVDWLIAVFNKAFASQNVILERSDGEPEYFAADEHNPARIMFAHGYLRSALHEISHWAIAGSHRRTLNDFGYWYAPDGRTEEQQKAFEQVEIKPQALECLFTLMCSKTFDVSLDNLDATFDTSKSTFKQDVYRQALTYIKQPDTIPKDAKLLLTLLCYLCHDKD